MTDKAFIKGLNVLTALVESEEPRALTSLSEQLGLTKSNTHRLLNTLIEQGFATQNGEKGLYRPTLRLWELGSRIVARLDVVSIAREQMPRLAEITGETVHLSMLEGEEVIYLDKIEGTHAVRSYTKVGARAPAWCVATGKILLAHRPPEEIAALAPRLTAYTPHTLTNPERLAQELDRARREGVAFNLGEWREDVVGAAAPIHDASGRVVAAIGISGPSLRLTQALLEQYSGSIISVGRDISYMLGYVGDKR
ncbi:MAG TPA: IclR family transcriptional regulator [Modicisalibacter sp.]|nr:IclR family transcriptional regulator [Modicisalibacter sp.]